MLLTWEKITASFLFFCFFPTKPQSRFPPSRKEAILELQVEKFRLQSGVVQKKKQAAVEPWSLNYFQIKSWTTQHSSCSCQPHMCCGLYLRTRVLVPEKDFASAVTGHISWDWLRRSELGASHTKVWFQSPYGSFT